MYFGWFSLLFICTYVIDPYFLGTVESVYYGHLGTSKKCPDYQGVLVVLYETEPFWTLTKCLDYAGVYFQVSTLQVLKILLFLYIYCLKYIGRTRDLREIESLLIANHISVYLLVYGLKVVSPYADFLALAYELLGFLGFATY